MSTLATLPVRDIAARDAFLFFWTTGPFLAIGAHTEVMRAWGFEPTALAFVGVKLNPRAPSLFFRRARPLFRAGPHERENAEFVILGRRGKPKRLAADVHEIVIAPRRESGRKPDEIYRRVERYCVGPRLDLFARASRDGWTAYGDEATKFDIPPVLDEAAP
jgi:N6-adenosine-specific RNA methylase IME4